MLLCESEKGYTHHFIYAIGHLAEAEDELAAEFPEWADKIRKIRVAMMQDPCLRKHVDALDELVKEYYDFWLIKTEEKE